MDVVSEFAVGSSYVFYLIGLPGVGKLSTACALADLFAGRRLVVAGDHFFSDPFFSLLADESGSVGSVPAEVWDSISVFRSEFLLFAGEHAHSSLSFCFTDFLPDSDFLSREILLKVHDFASFRSSVFVPVVLSCEPSVHLVRGAGGGRREFMKSYLAEDIVEFQASSLVPLLDIKNGVFVESDDSVLFESGALDRLLVLDTSFLSAGEAADAIFSFVSAF